MTDEEKKALRDSYFNEAVAKAKTGEAPTYAGTYDQALSDLYSKITNREAFSYDLNGDALYNQYKDNYQQAGKLAMKDTQGQAAALTGGYGSTYAEKVGQQTYDQYLQQLTDIVPELQNSAYQRYQDEGTALQNQYSMLSDLRDTEYNRWRDSVSDYNYNNEWQYGIYQDAENRAANDEETAYNRERDAKSDQDAAYTRLYNLIGSTGYSPTDDELTASGMSRAQANALIAAYQATQTASTSSGSGGSGSSSTNSSTTQTPKYTYGQVLEAAGRGGTAVVYAAVADGSITKEQAEAIIDYWNRQ